MIKQVRGAAEFVCDENDQRLFTVAGQVGLKSTRPLSQVGLGSTRPGSTRPGKFMLSRYDPDCESV